MSRAGQLMAKTVSIIATCPHCRRRAFLAPFEVIAFRYPDPAASFYRYRCPMCGELATERTTAAVWRLLTKGNVRVIDVRLEPQIPGPRISYDDLLDMHDELDHLPDPSTPEGKP